ncbi:MAG: nicotinate (nicotinamide) nucleotide adenylyltransferase [Pseudomonadota bacterium]
MGVSPPANATAKLCVLVLGGSFDPVHEGHVALATLFARLLHPDQLRIIPTGNPWQKSVLVASAEHRIQMLKLAFQDLERATAVPLVVDKQEIERAARQQFTYTIDTLRALRAEFGEQASIVFLIGADQLQNLHTWHHWQQLFELAHLCAASRPGFRLDTTLLPHTVAQEFVRRAGTPEQIRTTAFGLTCLASDLDVDISATQIRAELKQGGPTTSLVPAKVLDYIQQQHIYTN